MGSGSASPPPGDGGGGAVPTVARKLAARRRRRHRATVRQPSQTPHRLPRTRPATEALSIRPRPDFVGRSRAAGGYSCRPSRAGRACDRAEEGETPPNPPKNGGNAREKNRRKSPRQPCRRQQRGRPSTREPPSPRVRAAATRERQGRRRSRSAGKGVENLHASGRATNTQSTRHRRHRRRRLSRALGPEHQSAGFLGGWQ